MGCTNEVVKFLVVLGTGLGQPGGTGCRGGLGAGSPGTEPPRHFPRNSGSKQEHSALGARVSYSCSIAVWRVGRRLRID